MEVVGTHISSNKEVYHIGISLGKYLYLNNEDNITMMQPEALKPSWRGLQASGNQTPVSEVVGQVASWLMTPNNFGSQNVAINFVNCQVLDSDAAYVYSEWTLNIKYSDRQISGWGLFGVSLATALGVDIEMMDLDHLPGRWFHLVRVDNYQFGTNQQTGQPMTGNIWQVVKAMQPGEQPVRQRAAAPAPMLTQPPVNGVVAQPVVAQAAPLAAAPVMAAPVAVAPIAPTPAPMAQAAPIVVPQAAPPQVVMPEPAPMGDATSVALAHLHGSTLSDFFQKALADENIRAAPEITQAIVGNTFVAAKIASNEVIQNADGTHTVVALQ